MGKTSFGFPLRIGSRGEVSSITGDANIKAKIMQVLFTSPGERVMNPEFGCGLMNLVFDPNNEILAATTEFTITRALQRWMGEEILVENVDVKNEEETLLIEIAYVRKDGLERSEVKLAL